VYTWGRTRYTPEGLSLFNDPVFATIPKYNKYLIDERRIKWYCDLVELLCGIPTYPRAEVVVEMIDGELYEVGGNWRSVRRKVRERLAEMEADEA